MEKEAMKKFRDMVAAQCAENGKTPEQMCDDIERLAEYQSGAARDGMIAYADAWREALGIQNLTLKEQIIKEVLELTEEECVEVMEFIQTIPKQSLHAV